MVRSGSGADVNLRSSMAVQTTANKEALSSLDSQDVNAAIIYQLQWRKCGG